MAAPHSCSADCLHMAAVKPGAGEEVPLGAFSTLGCFHGPLY